MLSDAAPEAVKTTRIQAKTQSTEEEVPMAKAQKPQVLNRPSKGKKKKKAKQSSRQSENSYFDQSRARSIIEPEPIVSVDKSSLDDETELKQPTEPEQAAASHEDNAIIVSTESKSNFPNFIKANPKNVASSRNNYH